MKKHTRVSAHVKAGLSKAFHINFTPRIITERDLSIPKQLSLANNYLYFDAWPTVVRLEYLHGPTNSWQRVTKAQALKLSALKEGHIRLRFLQDEPPSELEISYHVASAERQLLGEGVLTIKTEEEDRKSRSDLLLTPGNVKTLGLKYFGLTRAKQYSIKLLSVKSKLTFEFYSKKQQRWQSLVCPKTLAATDIAQGYLRVVVDQKTKIGSGGTLTFALMEKKREVERKHLSIEICAVLAPFSSEEIQGDLYAVLKEDTDVKLAYAQGSTGVEKIGYLQATGQIHLGSNDNSPYGFVPSVQSGTYGKFTLDAQGHWRYQAINESHKIQALAAGETATERFTVKAVNGAQREIEIVIHGTNDAPRWVSHQNLTPVHPHGVNNGGDYIHALVKGEDIDHGSLLGVAITDVDVRNGEWQYSLDDGAHWHTIYGVLPGSALLLTGAAKIRFNPSPNTQGEGGITCHLWDQSQGSEGDKVDLSEISAESAFSLDARTLIASQISLAPVLEGLPTRMHLLPGDALDFLSTPLKLIYSEANSLAGGFFYLKSLGQDSLAQGGLFFLRSQPGIVIEHITGTNADYIANIILDKKHVARAHVKNQETGQLPGDSGIQLHFLDEQATLDRINHLLKIIGYTSQRSEQATCLICGVSDAQGHHSEYPLLITTGFQPSMATEGEVLVVQNEYVFQLDDFAYFDLGQQPLHALKILDLQGEAGSLMRWDAVTRTWIPAQFPLTLSRKEIIQGYLRFVPQANVPTEESMQIHYQVNNSQLWSTPLERKLMYRTISSKLAESEVLSAKLSIREANQVIAQGVIRDNRLAHQGKSVFAENQRIKGSYGSLQVDQEGHWSYQLEVSNKAVQQLAEDSVAEEHFTLKTLSGHLVPISIHIIGSNDAPVLVESRPFEPIKISNTHNTGNYVAEIFLSEDVDAGAEEGIAVIELDNSHGTWQYSLTHGNDWQSIPNVSEKNALLLSIDAKIRFVPNSLDPQASLIRFRAWDQTVGKEGDYFAIDELGPHSAFSTEIGTASIQLDDLAPRLVNYVAERRLPAGQAMRLTQRATRIDTLRKNLSGTVLNFKLLITGKGSHQAALQLKSETPCSIKKSKNAVGDEGLIMFHEAAIAKYTYTNKQTLTLEFIAKQVSSEDMAQVLACVHFFNPKSHLAAEVLIEIVDVTGAKRKQSMHFLTDHPPKAKNIIIPVSASQQRILAINDFVYTDSDRDVLNRIELHPLSCSSGNLFHFESRSQTWQPITHATIISADEIEQGYLKFVANQLESDQAKTLISYKVYDGFLWSDQAELNFLVQVPTHQLIEALPLVTLQVTGLDLGVNEAVVIDGKSVPIQEGQKVVTDHGYRVEIASAQAATQCVVSGEIKPSQLRSLVKQSNKSLEGAWTTGITLPEASATVSVEGATFQIIPFESIITFDNPLKNLGSDSKIQIVQAGALYSQLTHEQVLCINNAFTQQNGSALRGLHEGQIPVATQGNILRLIGDDAELDLSTLNTATIKNIQLIDLGADDQHAHQLTLTATDAIQLSQEGNYHHLIIEGGKYDKIKFKSTDGGSWKLLKDEEEIDNHHYHVYQGSVRGKKVHLYVNALMAA